MVYEIEFSGDARMMAVATYSPTQPVHDAQQAVHLFRVRSWPEIVSRSRQSPLPLMDRSSLRRDRTHELLADLARQITQFP
jgi:hypothetical protein